MAKNNLIFPRDEGAHKEIIEWWYLNGHLESESRKFGFALAFFKVHFKEIGIVLNPITPEIGYVTHLGITDLKEKKFYSGGDIFLKLPIFQGLNQKKLNIRYGPNYLKKEDAVYKTQMVTARPKKGLIAVNLEFASSQKPMIHGENGIINMANLGKSYYYSETDMPAKGHLRINSKKYQVTGKVWLDHQWGPFYVNRETGWNWFSIYLSDGTEVMAFNFYNEKDKKITPSVTIRRPNGKLEVINDPKKISFEPKDHWTSKKTGARYPISWKIRIGGEKPINIEVKAKIPEQQVVIQSGEYWEGACAVRGLSNKKTVTGNAYMELTGYDRLTRIKKIIEQSEKLK